MGNRVYKSARKDLGRFFRPKSIAIYGGSWASNVIQQLQNSGYEGEIWPVHPSKVAINELPCFRSTKELPDKPDAAFIGVNRNQTVGIVEDLAAAEAGGAICFASGFRERSKQVMAVDDDLQQQLVTAAGNMPLLGPNCYGYLNYLDNVCLWPDQHGGSRVDKGAAIVAQSSNIAINMTMQRSGLAISHMITVGNQAQTSLSDVVVELLEDPRVTAVGLYLEGFGDIRAFEAMADKARLAKIPLVALKVGKSEKGRQATLTHTATLAGNAVSSSAFLSRLGIAEVDSIGVLLQSLKILTTLGVISGGQIASVSCSGGEASLMADLAQDSNICFPDLPAQTQRDLEEILGNKVDLANPLDYHTYIWGDVAKMTACFTAVMKAKFDLNVFVLDLPRSVKCDPSGHECAIESIIAAKMATSAKVAVVSVLSENISEETARRFADAGVVSLHGMDTGLAAVNAVMGASFSGSEQHLPSLLGTLPSSATRRLKVLNEYQAKRELASYGISVPKSALFESANEIQIGELTPPLALKGLGIEHKTESNAVILDLADQDSLDAVITGFCFAPEGYLLEEMATDVVAELLLGVTVDDTGLVCLTIGAGGVLAELFNDSITVVLPSRRETFRLAIAQLKVSKILDGYRGRAPANLESLLDSIEALQQYVSDHLASVKEIDINPLLVGERESYAVDALLVKYGL